MVNTMQVFSIFDKKAGVYNTPFFCINQQVAVRSLCDLCSDARSFVAKHPEDYALYLIGEFDEFNGALTPSAPVAIAEAVACMPPVAQ